MADSCCENAAKFDGATPRYRRALLAVIAINAVMCLVEFSAGVQAQSQALQADALDFLADTFTYSLSLFVIGYSPAARAGAAMVKAGVLLSTGAWVLGFTAYRALYSAQPDAETMGVIGAVALAANLASVGILLRFRDGDANVRSVWMCSRNDAIGNVAVLCAAAGVWGTATFWPDLLVAAGMASLFLTGAVSIFRQALRELFAVRDRAPVEAASAIRHSLGHE